MRKINRTFGWVQNPSSISNLKNVLSIFVKDSYFHNKLINEKIPLLLKYDLAINEETMYYFVSQLSNNTIFKYSDLKGKGAGSGSRKDAKCSGIVQAAITGQKYISVQDANGVRKNIKKPYTDDWSADGFLRWAISLGLLDYNKDNDTCSITELGIQLVNTEDYSLEERDILGEAYLSYPPVARILSLLSENQCLTKFELGSQLGFIGEAGFTSIPQEVYISGFCEAQTPNEANNIRSNMEGSSDKYARMISGWLCEIGWLVMCDKRVSCTYAGQYYETVIGHSYCITAAGRRNLNRAFGKSNCKKIPKIVFFEMLATKTIDSQYVRTRRAHIIKYISRNERTLEDIHEYLKTKGINDSLECIYDDLIGFRNIGLSIFKIRNCYKITDIITKLTIPIMSPQEIKTNLSLIKDNIRIHLKSINHKYLSLIDLSFDSSANKEFEIQTMDLFTKELGFNGRRLGQASKPDGAIYYENIGIIVDNKAYKDGYNLPISQADEMVRYIGENQRRNPLENSNEWWTVFDNPDCYVDTFYFLFVSSFFKGNFECRLNNINQRTNIKGGAINSMNILYYAEKLKQEELSYFDFFNLFNNEEIK